MRPAPVYITTTSRPWAQLDADADALRAALLASVDPGTPTVYGNLLTMLLPLLIGCIPIDFISMHPRQTYCGALQPVDSLVVGSDLVSPVRCVRDLSIFIDADLMRTQVTQTCSMYFAAF